MRNIGIIGCGWLGKRLADMFSDRFNIYLTVRNPEKINHLDALSYKSTLINFGGEIHSKVLPWEILSNLDIIIITVPFSEKTESADLLNKKAEQLSSFLKDFTGQMFFMSSTGFYPIVDKQFYEDDLLSDDIGGERLILSRFPQTNVLRLAGLMGDDRLLIKYNVKQLDAPVNHIHYVDVARAIEKMIQCDVSAQLYNIVAPEHPSKSTVINCQKNLVHSEVQDPQGRIISSEKLIKTLDFDFKYPNPKYFHLDTF